MIPGGLERMWLELLFAFLALNEASSVGIWIVAVAGWIDGGEQGG